MNLSKVIEYAITDCHPNCMPHKLWMATGKSDAWFKFIKASQTALRQLHLAHLRKTWDVK